MCPSQEDLRRYLDGRLGEAERAAIDVHLRHCEECLELLGSMTDEGAEEIARVLRRQPLIPPRPRPPALDPARQVGLNLLFGVLALQYDFIRRHDHLAGFIAWVADKARPLAQMLVDRGALADARRKALEDLVTELLKQHEGDTEASLAAVSSLGSVHDDLERLNDADLQNSLAAAASRLAVDNGAMATYEPPLARRAGKRFRILRPHAEGGLGKVSVALDEELGRLVALKEIRPDKVADPNHLSRFILEAEVTGKLEHPGIVPVYSLGTDDDGRPYYAMRFVEGDSLQEAIAAHHRNHSRPDPATVEFRKMLGRFIDVCEAIDFAHSKGVLHRDLKPQNVMLGRFGETLVIDWGLAKATGPHEPASPDAAREATLVPPSGSGHAPSVGVLGTPAYMSPEQAAGAVESLGPATDIYGLGAILFALLTGQPPVAEGTGDKVYDVLDRVRRGDIRQPRQLNPNIPRALEAVCLKAVALKPEGRYMTARALADDIEHWLADEPVAACPDPPRVRLGRWVRRNRLKVVAAMTLLLASVVALAVVAILIEQGRKRITGEQERTRQALATAEDNARFAIDAVDRYFTKASEDRLRYVPRVDRTRSDLLVEAQDFYQRIVDRNSDNPAAKAELGLAFLRLAYINYVVPVKPGPISFGRRAQGIFEELARDNPKTPVYQDRLAESLHLLGELHLYEGQLSVSETLLRQALTIREGRVREYPEDDWARSALAGTLSLLGEVQGALGNIEQATESLKRSQELLTNLMSKAPQDEGYQTILAYTLGRLASFPAPGWPKARVDRYREEAHALWKSLVQKSPSVTEYRVGLAESHGELGGICESTDRPVQASQHFLEALAIWKGLQEDHPDLVSEVRGNAETIQDLIDSISARAGSFVAEGLRNHDLDHAPQADEAYRRAIACYERLVEVRPQVLDYQENLAAAIEYRGQLHRVTGRTDEAVRLHESALAILQQLAHRDPTNSSRRFSLAGASNGLGLALLAAGQYERSEASFRQSLWLLESLDSRLWGEPVTQKWVGGVASNLGLVLGRRGAYRASLAYLDMAIKVLDAGNHKGADGTVDWLAEAYHRRAEVLIRLGRDREAVQDCNASLKLDQLRSLEVTREETQLVRAVALARSGDAAGAVEVASYLSETTRLRGKDHFLLAQIYSVVSTLMSRDARSGPVQSKYLDRALKHLTRAEQAGYFQTPCRGPVLRDEHDLDPLNGSSVYINIINDQDFPRDPFAW